MQTKKAIMRKEQRSRMRALPAEERFKKDIALQKAVLNDPHVQAADTVLLFCSKAQETDSTELIRALLRQGKKVALPRCQEDGWMEYFCIDSFSSACLQPGYYGILEPVGDERPVLTERSVCIVPGVAFTRDGRRLGQGGGYYDRFLSAHPGLYSIGMTYESFVLDDIPCEPHDCGVDAVITEITGGEDQNG